MECISFIYKWKSRDLRRIIVSILKSWVADNVKKVNYVQNYSLKEWKGIEKNEEKILLVYTQDKNKLLDFLTKSFPQIEKINIS